MHYTTVAEINNNNSKDMKELPREFHVISNCMLYKLGRRVGLRALKMQLCTAPLLGKFPGTGSIAQQV